MEFGETTVVDSKMINKENIKSTLTSICNDLEEHGYSAIDQIVAYLISGDPGYISSYKECRNRIIKFNRDDLIKVMMMEFLEK